MGSKWHTIIAYSCWKHKQFLCKRFAAVAIEMSNNCTINRFDILDYLYNCHFMYWDWQSTKTNSQTSWGCFTGIVWFCTFLRHLEILTHLLHLISECPYTNMVPNCTAYIQFQGISMEHHPLKGLVLWLHLLSNSKIMYLNWLLK